MPSKRSSREALLFLPRAAAGRPHPEGIQGGVREAAVASRPRTCSTVSIPLRPVRQRQRVQRPPAALISERKMTGVCPVVDSFASVSRI
jgi:hypothetical protein